MLIMEMSENGTNNIKNSPESSAKMFNPEDRVTVVREGMPTELGIFKGYNPQGEAVVDVEHAVKDQSGKEITTHEIISVPKEILRKIEPETTIVPPAKSPSEAPSKPAVDEFEAMRRLKIQESAEKLAEGSSASPEKTETISANKADYMSKKSKLDQLKGEPISYPNPAGEMQHRVISDIFFDDNTDKVMCILYDGETKELERITADELEHRLAKNPLTTNP